MERCNCRLCKRTREYRLHIQNINNELSKKFFEDLYNYLNDIEFESEVDKIYLDNLRVVNPELYKQICSLEFSINIKGGKQ